MTNPEDKFPSTASTIVGSDKLNDERGAIWRRWEPHIHTPGTALNDDFGNTNLDTYLQRLEEATPTIQALGITDYLLTRRYREVATAKAEGRLPDVKLLFCNIEMRLSIETRASKGINLHLLVSPEDPDHTDQLERFLSKLTFFYNRDNFACTESDLRRLGKAHDSSIVDPETALKAGINQFKVDFRTLRQLYEETEWAQKNILVAVAGSSNDGTAGLQNESASFAATRKEIEEFAHVIFTATPKNIAFWRGDSVLTQSELEAKYRGVKPCLHGSDAHCLDRVAKPADDRFSWIKGDATFDALRQACLEPRSRVSIGDAPPTSDTPYAVATVTTPGLSWLLPEPLPINPGMVAIIGARGSGKTALADLIAHAGDNPYPAEGAQSFLTRARPFLRTAKVSATWTDLSSSSRQLADTPAGMADVHYLTQQFVDRLCSSVAESDELLEEIKRVVFLAHDPSSRLGADDFESLVRFRSSETQLALEALNQRLDRLSQEILVERGWYLRKKNLTRDLAKAKEELKKTEDARERLIHPGGKQRADYYTRLTTAITEREQEIQRVSRQLHAYKKLQIEVVRYRVEVFPQRLADLKEVYLEAPLTDEEWEVFKPVFSGDPTALLAQRVARHEELIEFMALQSKQKPSMSASPEELAKCSLPLLKAEQAAVGEQIGVDRKNIQRLEQLNKLFTTQDAKRRRLEEELNRADQSADRLQGFIDERADLYERFFDLIIEQCNILTELYGPLEARLQAAVGSASKLSLKVVRQVDVEAWALAGEALLDLRKNGMFRGRGALADAARQELVPAWTEGSASEVAAAMEAFRQKYDRSLLDQSAVEYGTDEYQQWVVDLGRWLYSTDHIKVHYSIEYERLAITQLSPGTRGIVLLLLYLALDLEDSRPLIIDQPEENLDPKSVFSELVELFREARLRRQVIIVTHNANLVVNTDVDQVIVASCVKHGAGSPPEFHYQSGGLEDASIRAHVCEILEGGEVAFKERAKRLRVRI
jgi:energy-coupling factor transporter ATP-binding protein EcfA2